MAGPAVGDRGRLTGLRRLGHLNGRRVEVQGPGPAGEEDGALFAVRLLFGVGAGTVMNLNAAHLDLDRDRAPDPALPPPAAATQALAPGGPPKEWRDWAGLPEELLVKVAEAHVAQTEAGWAAQGKEWDLTEARIQEEMAKRKRDGNCLFVFARVCKPWRNAQLKVGGPLRSRVRSDVILPGRWELAKWALAEGCPRDDRYYTMASAAAQYGHEELVRWLIQEQGFAMDRNVMAGAARRGNLELVRWLRGEGCDWSADTMASAAAQHGHRELVQWLIQEQGVAMTRDVMGYAAQGGNLALVRWLRGEGCDWCVEACEFAAGAGRLGVLQWLRANGCPWNAETCLAAAQFGQLATLRWARENGCDWHAEACQCAAERGHLEVLQWLRANGCPWNWDAEACSAAAHNGHLEVLQWLRANGCPWDAETCIWAARNGHLETLRWARENGCDWSAQACAEGAAYCGHLEVLQWLRAEGCPWDWNTCHIAVANHDVEMLRWARENGAPWHAGTLNRAAAKLGYTDDLGNLVDFNGNPVQ